MTEELKPRDYQERGIEWLMATKRACLSDDMRIGKCCQSICASDRQEFHKILVICSKSLKHNWKNEIRLWAKNALPITFCGGSRKEKLEALRAYRFGWLIVNPEALRDREILRELFRKSFDLVISDESHHFSGRKSLQTKGMVEVARRIPNLYLLTGTPIQNRPEELWPLLHMIDPKRWSSFWAFVKKHADAKMGRYGWEIGDQVSDPQRLAEEIKDVFLRRTKEEVGIANTIEEKTVWVELEGKQRQVYREMEKRMFAEINPGELLVASVILAKLTRLKQICVHPRLVGAEWDQSAKFDALVDLIRDTDEKVVVFSQFSQALYLLDERLAKEGITYTGFTGDVTDPLKRQEAVDRFQNDPSVRVFRATLGAGGEGINLPASRIVVRLDKHWNPAKNQQAGERVWKKGREESILDITLQAKDTFEEKIQSMLDGKTDMTRAVLKYVEERIRK